jgi:hypothetical protein
VIDSTPRDQDRDEADPFEYDESYDVDDMFGEDL